MLNVSFKQRGTKRVRLVVIAVMVVFLVAWGVSSVAVESGSKLEPYNLGPSASLDEALAKPCALFDGSDIVGEGTGQAEVEFVSSCKYESAGRQIQLLVMGDTTSSVADLLALSDCQRLSISGATVCVFSHPLGETGTVSGSGIVVDVPSGAATLSVFGQPLSEDEATQAAQKMVDIIG